MSEHLNSAGTTDKQARPFPWYCPKCRHKEVRRTTMRYEFQRPFDNRPVTITVDDLAVPRCGNCGELVFDYQAEEQLNQAFENHTRALAANHAKLRAPQID